MREIKFRGKTKEGKWIYGSGIIKVIENCTETKKIEMISTVDYDELDYYVPMYDNEEVIPETVGQYTGLKDKNGKEIYEGDIVYFDYINVRNYEIVFEDGAYWIRDKDNQYITLHEVIAICKRPYNWEVEVIGNIYDNPELLGGNNGD